MGKTKRFISILFVLGLALSGLSAQDLGFLNLQVNPEIDIPLGDSALLWRTGGGVDGRLQFQFPPETGFLSLFQPFLGGGARWFSNDAEGLLSLGTGAAGLEIGGYLSPRFGLGGYGSIGLYQGDYQGVQATNWYWQAGGTVKFRLSPALAVELGANYHSYQAPSGILVDGLGIQANLRLNLGGLQEGRRLQLEDPALDPVYPVLYSQYDRNPLGKLHLVNHEEGSIQKVQVSFFVNKFMDSPKVCSVLPEISQNGSATIDLLALFNAEVLKQVEATKSLAIIQVDYEFLGSARTARFEQTLQIHNRNAMNWDDDRKAAAFVSAKDPAVLRYSRYVAGLIREAGLEGVPSNLRYAVGLFEALRLMGINYVVDPTTPFTELSKNTSATDFLQYPYETLTYKGGDCDDLSILFASVLESVGISTAFVTVPGHIYVAFDLGLNIRDADRMLPDMDDLIVQDYRVWVPVEITLLKTGFVKAWSFGAQEWREAKDKGKLIPMDEAWGRYDPVSPPGQDTRITLPDDKSVEASFRQGMDKLVAMALPAKFDQYKKLLAAKPDDAQVLNRVGILHARYGKYAEAKSWFEQAREKGFSLAETNLGKLAFISKDYKAARSSYERSLRANPTDSATLLGLSLTLYEMGLYDQASSTWDRLFQVNPELAEQNSFLQTRK